MVPGQAAARHDWVEEHLRPAGSLAGAAVYRWGDVIDVVNGSAPASVALIS